MALKYKAGDQVRIKSLDWYNENKDELGKIDCSEWNFTKWYTPYCGAVMTIRFVWEDDECYKMFDSDYHWTDEMIEGLVEEENKPKFKVGDTVKWYNHTCNITSIDTNENTYTYLIKNNDYREDKTFAKWVHESELTVEDDEETKSIDFTIKATDTKGKVEVVIPEGYGYVVESDKLYFITKKKEYPKTYEECCKVLDITPIRRIGDIGYKRTLLNVFEKLLICRDAYWKIAGEEMGLRKPWELSIGTPIYYIYYNRTVGTIKNDYADDIQCNIILAFPTEEMRDAFYENFKELIEECKELL